MPKGGWLIHPGRVAIVYGSPIYAEETLKPLARSVAKEMEGIFSVAKGLHTAP